MKRRHLNRCGRNPRTKGRLAFAVAGPARKFASPPGSLPKKDSAQDEQTALAIVRTRDQEGGQREESAGFVLEFILEGVDRGLSCARTARTRRRNSHFIRGRSGKAGLGCLRGPRGLRPLMCRIGCPERHDRGLAFLGPH